VYFACLCCIVLHCALRFSVDFFLADSSPDPCSGQYRGEEAESEAEVQSIVKFLTSRASRFIAFVTYHSYGERILTRWDHSKHLLPDDHGNLVSVLSTPELCTSSYSYVGLHKLSFSAAEPVLFYQYLRSSRHRRLLLEMNMRTTFPFLPSPSPPSPYRPFFPSLLSVFPHHFLSSFPSSSLTCFPISCYFPFPFSPLFLYLLNPVI